MPISSPVGADQVRTAVRFPLHLDLLLSTSIREYHAVTEDVSACGVLFIADEVPPLESKVKFHLTMPADVMGGTEDVLLDCEGRIARHATRDGK